MCSNILSIIFHNIIVADLNLHMNVCLFKKRLFYEKKLTTSGVNLLRCSLLAFTHLRV